MKRDINEDYKEFSKIHKRMIKESKPRLYDTSQGRVLLNPIKMALKGGKYINPEFNKIMEEELKSAIESLKG